MVAHCSYATSLTTSFRRRNLSFRHLVFWYVVSMLTYQTDLILQSQALCHIDLVFVDSVLDRFFLPPGLGDHGLPCAATG